MPGTPPGQSELLYPLRDASRRDLNFGFWQSVESKPGLPEGHFNRLLEQTVDRLGGRKSLYSDSFYPMEEFRRIYGGEAYDSLRRRYDPGHRFPDLYHKTVLRK